MSSDSDIFGFAQNFDSDSLRKLVENGERFPNSKNGQGQNPLQVLLEQEFEGHLYEELLKECVDLLIKLGCDVNGGKKNRQCPSPLSLALQNGFESCVRTLLENDAKLCESVATEIAKKMPNVMMEILDGGVEVPSGDKKSNNPLIINLDWRPVIRPTQENPGEAKAEPWWKQQRETTFLHSLVDIEDLELRKAYLTHPLVSAFLHLKKLKLKKLWMLWLLQVLMIIYPLACLFLTWWYYMGTCKVDRVCKNWKKGYSGHSFKLFQSFKYSDPEFVGSFCDAFTTQQSCDYSIFASIMAVILASVLVTTFCFKAFLYFLFFVIGGRKGARRIFSSWNTWVGAVARLVLLVNFWPLMTFTSLPPDKTIAWQLPIAAAGSVVSSVLFLSQLAVLPGVKLYLEMLMAVFFNVIKITVLFAPLLLGFYLGFDLMYFLASWNPFVYIRMILDPGSNDYDKLISNRKDASNGQYSWGRMAAYTFPVMFIISISITFMNFLLGVSTTDIKVLRKRAEIMNLTWWVEKCFLIDLIFPHLTKFRVVQENSFKFPWKPSDDNDMFTLEIRTKLKHLAKRNFERGIPKD